MKSLLLDSNLLVLLVVGAVNRRWIERHKRLKAFIVEDWDLLVARIGSSAVLTTPHVLAEASNLLRSGGLTREASDQLMAAFGVLIGRASEEHVPAAIATGSEAFLRLGLTDAALLQTARHDVVLLTMDLELYLATLRQGWEAENFNHLRHWTV